MIRNMIIGALYGVAIVSLIVANVSAGASYYWGAVGGIAAFAGMCCAAIWIEWIE